ncbi:hypothetical protein M0765_013935 [Variovorax sp. S2]|uniref:hypothetical protein n=1 Tax=Variovorax sp. S12S4 TaxID=3029170 RepID=UPI00215C74BA|nr:hypothetical protein [Variovorax sp. S12S4]MCR8958787.1 hypothetical protein [Variovorax sp. S12S4]
MNSLDAAPALCAHTAPEGLRCSHAPGEPLPLQFLKRLARASGAEQIWHSLALKSVPGVGI